MHVRPDARGRAGRAASRARGATALGRQPGARDTGPGRRRDRRPAAAPPAATAAPAGAVVALAALVVALRSPRSALALAVAGGAARRAGAATPLGELERALRRTGRARPPATTLQRARAPLRGARPAAAGYVRALRDAALRRTARRPTPRAARAACAASWPAAAARGRLRAWRALPPGPVRPAPTLEAMDDVYDLFSAGPRCSRPATSTPRPSPLARARDLEPEQDLDPRGARPRATSARASSRGARAEFEAVVERAPTNDYALFCLGRSLPAGPPRRGPQAARAGRSAAARAAGLPHLQGASGEGRLTVRPLVNGAAACRAAKAA